MKRRDFLKQTVAAAGLAGTATMLATATARAADQGSTRLYYELRTYSLTPAQLPRLDAYLEKALLPALNRYGLKPVGVFHDNNQADAPLVHVLIPFTSLEDFAGLSDRLAADKQHEQDGAAYLNTPATDPAFTRIDSSLLHAFSGMPGMNVPPQGARIFQLRIYESHSEHAGKKKVEMFNKAEIALFKRVGLTPVLFGETILGARRPNLTYLLTFPDAAAKDKAWNTFRTDPEWLQLKAVPEYMDKNIVSKITNKVIEPAPYSQI